MTPMMTLGGNQQCLFEGIHVELNVALQSRLCTVPSALDELLFGVVAGGQPEVIWCLPIGMKVKVQMTYYALSLNPEPQRY